MPLPFGRRDTPGATVSETRGDGRSRGVDERLLAILTCPRCGTALGRGDPGLLCESGHAYPVRDGIPLLWADGEDRSALETIDYDAVHGIGPPAIARIGSDWAHLFAEAGHAPGDVLEIGAGTGALTRGLLSETAPRSLVVTDVSETFLRPLVAAVRDGPVPVHGVAYDTNVNVFREGSFDTVVGRSVLHHLLDYRDVLASLRPLLREGGIVAVFEPVLHGKTILSLLIGMLLKAHEMGWQTVLTADEAARMRRLVRHQTKGAWYPQDRQSLSKLNDKYIFDVESLLAEGRALGYANAEFRQAGDIDTSYWLYLRHTLAVAGIDQAKLGELKWVCDVFAETYGLVLGSSLTRPMGTFVFRR